ncbi:sugar transporter [Psychrobacter phenylpyruvicus]|uniref:Sugar efflux transporter n=1 Tax=Psychrobacter phenylpyruvicus TaxID=29432 RepID=A0A379LL88_9GAMM|nr:sugar transporter [Psychrobacter phenylpyruvicus]SUD90534.1 Sugar efflux transporter [Psychrobacter phenylpyruvicus]
MTHTPKAETLSRRTQYIQVILMGISAFVMNTTEFVPVALLSDIARDFSITTAETGWMLTLYAWIVAAMSLPLMLLTSKLERKKLLLGLFAVFIVSHILSVVAWSFNVLLISRVGIAFSHAIFWSITAAIAIRVAPEDKRAFALSVVATGTSLAMVLGVPLGRIIGQWYGWRATFGGIGFIALVVFILQARLLPTLPSMFKGSFRKVPELLKNPLLVCLYLLIFTVFTAHYTAYSYIEPFMREIGSISENFATFILLLFGGAGIIGSVIFSRWGDRHSTLLMFVSIIIMLLSMLSLLLAVNSVWALSLNATLWGTALMLLIISMQAKVLMVDQHAQDMLMSMFSGIINLGIGTGALFGGYAVTHISLSSIGYVGSVISLVALLLILFMVKQFPVLRRS